MATTKNGFLLNWNLAKMLDDFKLTDEQYGFVIRRCVEAQRDGTPLPMENVDPIIYAAFMQFDYVIKQRRHGQRGGLANYERNAKNYIENPEHYSYKNEDDDDYAKPF
jgi:hypothetical protein